MKSILLVLYKMRKSKQPFDFQSKKKLQELIKVEKKIEKPTPHRLKFMNSTRLIWQAHYQILFKYWLKEFIKLNTNTSTILKNVKLAESNIKIVTALLNTETFKMI